MVLRKSSSPQPLRSIGNNDPGPWEKAAAARGVGRRRKGVSRTKGLLSRRRRGGAAGAPEAEASEVREADPGAKAEASDGGRVLRAVGASELSSEVECEVEVECESESESSKVQAEPGAVCDCDSPAPVPSPVPVAKEVSAAAAAAAAAAPRTPVLPSSAGSRSLRSNPNPNPNPNPSFFSPPRALLEPVPFLSPPAPSYRDHPGTEHVRLLLHPVRTLSLFRGGAAAAARAHLLPRLAPPGGLPGGLPALSLALALAAAAASALLSADGAAPAREALFWLGCGILSTAGLGSGVQTGALVLFPHVTALAATWAEAGTGAGTGAGAGQDLDRDWHRDREPYSALLWAVAVPGFWSGTGSAIGELLPYVLARMIRGAGGDPFALLMEDPAAAAAADDDDDNNNKEASGRGGGRARRRRSWTSVLVANTRSAMEGQMLERNAFLKIFVLAAVPNGLFDLCGLVCGSCGVPFGTFFGAVWSGKALVRTPLQTCGLAALVVHVLTTAAAPDEAEAEDQGGGGPGGGGPSVSGALLRFGRDALRELVREDGEEEGVAEAGGLTAVGAVKMAWTAATFALMGFFLLSTIEQIAQHHAKSLARAGGAISGGGQRLRY